MMNAAERSAFANGFDAGWQAAMTAIIDLERRRVAPDPNRIRDFEARKFPPKDPK